jgi:cell wall-associated NlpC family hydrolase
VLVALLAVVAAAVPVSADPVGDKRREAQQIADRIEALGDRAADLGEKANDARLALDGADAAVAKAQAQLAVLERRLGVMRASLSRFAVRSYIYADQTGGLAGLLSGTSVTAGAAQRQGYEGIVLGAHTDMTDDVKALVEDAAAHRVALAAARQRQADVAASFERAKRDANNALAEQRKLLTQTRGELATLVAQERVRRAAAAAAAARAAVQGVTRQRSLGTASVSVTRKVAARPTTTPRVLVTKSQPQAAPIDIPPTSSGAAAAVRAALSQLGKPYRFAAAGPDAYDCSGLTMWAWAHAGVSMPHGSVAQYGMFPHVPLSAMQPGDLVVFYSDLHHVGLYIGGGMMVHAPRTGDVVRVAAVGPHAMGAARP